MAQVAQLTAKVITPCGLLLRLSFPLPIMWIDCGEGPEVGRASGGFIVDPPRELPGGSRLCLFDEPSGVTLAMIQATKKSQPVAWQCVVPVSTTPRRG